MAKNGRLISTHFGDKPLFLALYFDKPGVVYDTPPGTERVAHVTYLKPNATAEYWSSSVDYFKVDDHKTANKLVSNKNDVINVRTARESARMKKAEEEHAVKFEILEQFRGSPLEKAVRLAALKDIYTHTRGAEKPMIRSDHFTKYVDQIVSTATIQRVLDPKVDPEGKQSFFLDCVLDLNLDYADWCVAAVTREGKLAPWNDCLMCYASYKHKNFPSIVKADTSLFIEAIREARSTRDDRGQQTRFLRLGKRTEAAADIFRDHLLATLEAAEKEKLSVVLPTKFIRFDKEIAEGLKRTDSTLLISLGNDKFEVGPALLGYNNDFRFEQGILYQEVGVRTIPYVLVNARLENGGPHYSANLERAIAAFKQVQILPVRSRHTHTSNLILGGWHDLVGELGHDLFGNMVGGFEKSNDHTRISRAVHKSLLDKIGQNDGNVRMCHHNSKMTYCGGCFMAGVCGVAKPHEKTVTIRRDIYEKAGGKTGVPADTKIILVDKFEDKYPPKKDKSQPEFEFVNPLKPKERELLSRWGNIMLRANWRPFKS